MAKRRKRKTLTVDELLDMRFDEMPFRGQWKDSFGVPEKTGTWIVWGASGNGKTRFSLMLAKYLTEFGRVAYNTLEEGAKKSFQRAVGQSDLQGAGRKMVIWNALGMDEMRREMGKQRSPGIIIIDSLQYTFLDAKAYKALKSDYPKKLFIFISHADGREPRGALAQSVRYDADVKVRVEGYKAFPTSRYGGGVEFVVWEEGAKRYWGE